MTPQQIHVSTHHASMPEEQAKLLMAIWIILNVIWTLVFVINTIRYFFRDDDYDTWWDYVLSDGWMLNVFMGVMWASRHKSSN